MKWSISRVWLAGLLMAVLSATFTDVCAAGVQDGRHGRRVEEYRRGWSRLVPRYSKLQYAGSMGLLSLGVGWDYGRHKQWETDFMLGFLPKFQGERSYLTMTLKENYIPWRCRVGRQDKWVVEPFTVSLYANQIFGSDFWLKEPDKYPDSFYGFSTSLRFNLAFGERVRLNLGERSLMDHMTFFYEVGTCDLYLISYVCNTGSMHLSDIFSLSLGLKFHFL